MILVLLGFIGYLRGQGEKSQLFLRELYPQMSTLDPSPAEAPVVPAPTAVSAPVVPPPASAAPAAPAAAVPNVPPAPAADVHHAISETAVHLDVPSIEMQTSMQQTPENIKLSSDSGEALPKMKQALKIETLAAPEKKATKLGTSSPSAGKGIQPENQSPFLQNPNILVVKNGDTLMGIAFRYFPENTVDGLKKILAVNPMIDDVDRIYTGQELIIPYNGPDRKDSN